MKQKSKLKVRKKKHNDSSQMTGNKKKMQQLMNFEKHTSNYKTPKTKKTITKETTNEIEH